MSFVDVCELRPSRRIVRRCEYRLYASLLAVKKPPVAMAAGQAGA